MNISILTSRFGPNNRQVERFENLISTFDSSHDKFYHGGDRGDDTLHDKLLLQKFTVEIYPCQREEVEDMFKGIKVHEASRLDERNKKLMTNGDVIIAIPQYMNEWEDSPMWKTTRAAIAAEKKIYIISPVGYLYEFRR